MLEDYACKENRLHEIVSTVFRMEGSPFECIFVDSSIIGKKEIAKIPSFDRSGAYILWRNSGSAITAYAGKSTNLMNRFTTHFTRPENEDYRNDWTLHLGITRVDTDYGFSDGEISSIEDRLNNLISCRNGLISLNKGGTKLGINVDETIVDKAVEFIKLVIQEHFGCFLGESNYKIDENSNAVDKSKLTRTDYATFDGEMTDIPTPDAIVKQMVDLIPLDKYVPESKFLDLAAKRGEFLKEIRDRLLEAPAMKKAFPSLRDRLEHIESNMLYGVCLTSAGYDACMQNVEMNKTHHILRASPVDTCRLHGATYYIERIKGENYAAMYKGQYIGVDALRELTRKFGDIEDWGENIMKFDVVIGNPPYNNDLYLDFVQAGYQALKDDGVMVMITPAKWQAKGGKKNEAFREQIVPHMKEIVYYPREKDIFDISAMSGVTYFLADKNEHNIKTIVNICSRREDFNNTANRCINDVLNNQLLSITDKLRNVEHIKVNSSRTFFYRANQRTSGTSDRYDAIVMAGSTDGSKQIFKYALASDLGNADKIDKYKAIMSFKVSSFNELETDGKLSVLRPVKKYLPKEVCKDDFLVLRLSNNESEIDSFISYMNTKFVNFLVLCGNVGMNLSNEESWRFVPAPDAFDHIFTDAELYQKYGLTQDEINIIESVIKKRK